MLTDEQRRRLVDVARRSVAARISGGRWTAAVSPDLPQAPGVFVTLKLAGQLRGCLGRLECVADLAGEVARCAADAASEDARFPPVTATDLPALTLEVSVLGPLERIDPRAAGALTIGLHGLVVEQGRHRGLLLPQVATEWDWSAEQFLRQTCHKAGLAPEAWEHGAIVYRFAAEVFGDVPEAGDQGSGIKDQKSFE
jgi:AmmeMemoRadiSam system protein A